MKKLEVGLGSRSYSIAIGGGNLSSLGAELTKINFPQRLLVVTNPTVAGYYLQSLTEVLGTAGFKVESFEIPDGEQFKSLATLESIFDYLIRNNFDRRSGLIALGGGVVGDIVGFAAASYLRGVPFVQVPTTLLAQVDSSVGGKTAVNHALGKNLIGAFYQPSHVCIDVDTLKSLPDREYRAGLAEVAKYGVIRDREFFDWLMRHANELMKRDADVLIHAVTRSCQIKANIVELDERESSLRAILNYGHTIGHAVEKLVGYGEVRHGEAVAIGMVAAAQISASLDLCTAEDVKEIRDLLVALGLSVVLPAYPLSDYIEIMCRDKKVISGMLRMVLNRGIGDCEIREIDNPERVMTRAIPYFAEGNEGA